MTRSSAEQQLAAVARRQWNVFHVDQAVEAGMHPRTVARRAVRGRYRRLHRSVYAEAASVDSWEGRAMAALLQVGAEAVLSCGTAARLHGWDLPVSASRDLHVVVRSRTVAVPGVHAHRSLVLGSSDVVRRGAFRLTAPYRTIRDLAGEQSPAELRRTLASAVRAGDLTGNGLRVELARRSRFRGAVALRALVDELSPLDADCRSVLETDFLRLMRRAGLSPTAMNHPVVDASGRRRVVDAAWLPEMLPVELDSASHHGSLLDWHDDLRRENAIVLTGWRDFLRFSAADVRQRPDQVVAEVRTALRAARTSVE